MQYEQVEKYYQVQKVLKKKRLPRGRRRSYQKLEGKSDSETATLRKHFPNRRAPR